MAGIAHKNAINSSKLYRSLNPGEKVAESRLGYHSTSSAT